MLAPRTSGPALWPPPRMPSVQAVGQLWLRASFSCKWFHSLHTSRLCLEPAWLRFVPALLNGPTRDCYGELVARMEEGSPPGDNSGLHLWLRLPSISLSLRWAFLLRPVLSPPGIGIGKVDSAGNNSETSICLPNKSHSLPSSSFSYWDQTLSFAYSAFLSA